MKIDPSTLRYIRMMLEDREIRDRVHIAEYLENIDPALYDEIFPKEELYFTTDDLFSRLLIAISRLIE